MCNPDFIKSSYLFKSKLYMKIIELLYLSKLKVITLNIIKDILKDLHLFKDVILALKSCIIKTLPKFDKTVV